MDCLRVLSVQSHVVSGYVGNKSATFPLQLLGFEVDAINSVQFSNHTGYSNGVRGQVLDDGQLAELIEGLQINGLDHYSHVINGYIGNDSFLKQFAKSVTALKAKNPGLVYVCDPVMGDHGPGWYVPKSLLPIYRNEILPLADICVPNQFEAELLTGRSISNEQEALEAMDMIHAKGVGTVILSSTDFHNDPDHLICIASQKSSGTKSPSAFKITFPRFKTHFVGTGDLFTALMTAWLTNGGSLQNSLEKTIATMQAVLSRTLTSGLEKAKAREGDAKKMIPHDLELKLIQSKADIEKPQVAIKAMPIK